jgi:cyclopropane-fatty-acyl-phospholipid synthase
VGEASRTAAGAPASFAREAVAPSLAARLVLGRLRSWDGHPIEIELPDGSLRRFGDAGAARPIRIGVHDPRFFRRLLRDGEIGAGESYMAGEWTCSDLPALVRSFLVDQSVVDHGVWAWLSSAVHRVRRVMDRNTRAGSRRNIGHHYDLSNELFATFLDPSMTYSSAVFDADGAGLEQAQRAKIDGACRALGLRAGDELLEIGSGWGALAMHAAREYGCRVTSVTLSGRQLELARERVRRAGLADRIGFELCDYRDIRGSFDHIVSIEMLEAVGAEYYDTFFRACDRLLRPGGRMFLQSITVPDQRFDSYRKQFDWIRKYIYPGGCLASHAAIVAALKHSTSLRVESLREIGAHYEPTLRQWRERFLARQGEVRRLGFDDRFVRMWEFYLASCEAAFATGHIGNLQLVLSRPQDVRRIEV